MLFFLHSPFILFYKRATFLTTFFLHIIQRSLHHISNPITKAKEKRITTTPPSIRRIKAGLSTS